jgi:glyoxylase-like metal-dependent hydrolase (beta-lactamase superfamily II)
LNSRKEPMLVFRNAIHYVSFDQWQWANCPNSREIGSFFKINFDPIEKSGKLKLIDEAGRFTPSIELLKFDGHTKGQLIPKINYGDKTIVFTADFIPSAAHIPLPYIASVDIQPLIALKEKEAFLKEAVENNYYLVFEHDADTECCNLVMNEKGVVLKTSFMLNEILN